MLKKLFFCVLLAVSIDGNGEYIFYIAEDGILATIGKIVLWKAIYIHTIILNDLAEFILYLSKFSFLIFEESYGSILHWYFNQMIANSLLWLDIF